MVLDSRTTDALLHPVIYRCVFCVETYNRHITSQHFSIVYNVHSLLTCCIFYWMALEMKWKRFTLWVRFWLCQMFQDESMLAICIDTELRIYELRFREIVLRQMCFQPLFKKSSEVNMFHCLKTGWSVYERTSLPHSQHLCSSDQPDTFLIYMHHQNELLFRHLKWKLINFVCTTLGKKKKVTPAKAVEIHFHSVSSFSYCCMISSKSGQTHGLDCWTVSWHSSLNSLKRSFTHSSSFLCGGFW